MLGIWQWGRGGARAGNGGLTPCLIRGVGVVAGRPRRVIATKRVRAGGRQTAKTRSVRARLVRGAHHLHPSNRRTQGAYTMRCSMSRRPCV